MTDEILITKFLDSSFRVTTGKQDFMVEDTTDFSKTTYNSFEFIKLFKRIISDFTTDTEDISSVEIFNKWFSVNKRVLAKKLTEYFDTMDGSLGSNVLLQQAIDKFSNSEYNHIFIQYRFNDFYTNTYLKPTLKAYIERFDIRLDSQQLIDNISNSLYNENMFQYDYAINYLNTWYCDTLIKSKVDDFLAQLVITLGRTNWQVTWVGHGPVTNDTLRRCFKQENSFQFNYIKGLYEEWYEEEIINRTKRIISNNNILSDNG